MGFGKLLEQKMSLKNIKQAELAEAVDIPKTTLSSMIQRDNTKIEIEKFLKICDYLDCNPEEFYDEFRKQNNNSIAPSFIKKYSFLDEYGKKAVDSALDIQYERCVKEHEQKPITAEKTYPAELIAHDGINRKTEVTEQNLINAIKADRTLRKKP